MTKKKRSTNPFDCTSAHTNPFESDFSDALTAPDAGNHHDDEPRRPASLNLNRKGTGETPALIFNSSPNKTNTSFTSPLENALVQETKTPSRPNIQRFDSMDSSIDSEENEIIAKETSSLLGEHTSNYYSSSFVDTRDSRDWIPISNDTNGTLMPRNPSKSSLSIDTAALSRQSAVSKNRVLRVLTATRQDNEYKLIRLEDVGTAKSWLILLLPYFAFVVCLLLESNTSLQVSELGPLISQQRCLSDRNTKFYTVPIAPAPPDPCVYDFDFSGKELSPLLDEAQLPYYHQKGNATKTTNKARGSAFDSGIITSVPPASTFLSADASFYNLSLTSMRAIQQGSVLASGLLFQKKHNDATKKHNKWSLVATSRTKPLAVACNFETGRSKSQGWVCRSPKLMDILFFRPGSAVLSGEELRINILFSYIEGLETNENKVSSATYLYADSQLQKMLQKVEIPTKEDRGVVFEIARSSEFVLRHTNSTALAVDVCGRVVSLVLTIVFAIFWFRRLGCCCSYQTLFCGKKRDNLYKIRHALSLLDSPWVLFPERWYIAMLFFSIILIQGPLVVVMYFNPKLNTNPKVKTASDCLVGVGVNAVLLVYLSLFQGFQFHTASAARRWVDHHRKLNEIRRVAKYLGDKREEEVGEKEALIQYTADYFVKHGDIDGTALLANLRLQHDPFGSYWADFLIPKLILFAFGALSIFGTAYTRFHFTSTAEQRVSKESLDLANLIYLVAYLSQLGILILWIALILRASLVTGHKLKLQPFLATRPAQLSYRVIFAHVTLGFLSLAVMALVEIEGTIHRWRSKDDEPDHIDQDPVSSFNFWLQLVSRLAQRFPYSGTAASIGFGRIFFATVSILIAGFIFLPPKHGESFAFDDTHDTEALDELSSPESRLRQRSDKRAVVTMMKNSHTWRIFPLAIERVSVIDQMLLHRTMFQLYSNGQRDYTNLNNPGAVSVGPYIPVFSTELACWLLEASFQAYYSPTATVEWKDHTPGEMNLSSIGLRLEAAILDEATNTQAFVATNISDQVDSAEDQCIVIAFRGSVDATNARTDLKYSLVPLLDQIIGVDSPPFRVSASGVRIEDGGGWLWNVATEANRTVSCFSPTSPLEEFQCMPFRSNSKKTVTPFSAVSKGAMAVLSATPVARNTLPCIHEGFSEVYAVLRRKVIESVLPVFRRQLANALQKSKDDSENVPLNLPKIYVTGHSLGGSLAQLLALDLASNCEVIVEGNTNSVNLKPEAELFQLPTPTSATKSSVSERRVQNPGGRISLQPPICCYTFGQPRVGNRAFSRLYKQRVPHTFRVATEGDPFTAMPHVVCCAGIYKHAGLEVVY